MAVQAKIGEVSISCFGSDYENRRSNVSDLPLLYLFSVEDGIIIDDDGNCEFDIVMKMVFPTMLVMVMVMM